jgi:alpha-glucuronidase
MLRVFLLLLLGQASCAPSSPLWLNFTRVSSSFAAAFNVTALGCSLLPGPLCGELRAGLTGLLGALPGGGRALTVALPAGAPLLPSWPPSPSLEGYNITVGADGVSLSSASLQGALYGAWRLLALVQAEAPSLLSPGVAEESTPRAALRMWDLWDNLDGSVERGYAGASILYPLGKADPARVTDFARLLSSMGINAIVLDNVNACGNGNERVLDTPSLQLLAPIAGTFYAYGVHALLVPCWTSPQTVGGLNTSDPRVPEVTAWWSAKIGEASTAFPAGAFRGLLFKGDTEGQPGPNTYNLTELWGANYFGALLAPASAIVVWRAFSHPPNGRTMPVDQALFQFQRFAGWDGNTRPNVVLQTKNGPYDFQAREPVHSLFGALPRVNVVLEFEATPEYLGQDVHAMALPLQWATYLSFDLCGAGGGDTTLGGVVARGAFSGMAAVSNFGAGGSWTGHPLNAVNAFGFGRLAWAPAAPPLAVVREWAALTFPGSAPAALDGVVALLGDTWTAYENFTASLGWGFACAGDHYHMAPAARQDYINASKTRVGYNRGAGGYGATYSGAARAAFTSLDACPEELLLSFFNVPYTHALRGARYGGRSVLQWIYESHAAGAAASAGFVGRWAALQGGLAADPAEFSAVAALLGRAAEDAAAFAATVVGFFVNLTGVPP